MQNHQEDSSAEDMSTSTKNQTQNSQYDTEGHISEPEIKEDSNIQFVEV